MRKIKDRVALGIMSGLLGGTPDTVVNALEHRAGLTDVNYGQMAASLFLKGKDVNSTKGKIVGQLGNYTMISAVSVLITYLLAATGRDRALVKGAGAGALAWFLIYGLGGKLGVTVRSKKPLAPVLSFLDHVLYGSLCALIASRLGDSSLFPEARKDRASLPLFGSGAVPPGPRGPIPEQ